LAAGFGFPRLRHTALLSPFHGLLFLPHSRATARFLDCPEANWQCGLIICDRKVPHVCQHVPHVCKGSGKGRKPCRLGQFPLFSACTGELILETLCRNKESRVESEFGEFLKHISISLEIENSDIFVFERTTEWILEFTLFTVCRKSLTRRFVPV
jgi:hypothetical protein